MKRMFFSTGLEFVAMDRNKTRAGRRQLGEMGARK